MPLSSKKDISNGRGRRNSKEAAWISCCGRSEIAALSHEEISGMRREELEEIVQTCLPSAMLNTEDRPDDHVLRQWVCRVRSTCRKQGY